MTTVDEQQAAIYRGFAERKRRKSYGRLAKMKAKQAEREQFESIPASQRQWCTRTCKWIDDGGK